MLQIWRDRPGKAYHASQVTIKSHEEIFKNNEALLDRYKATYGDGDQYNLFYTLGEQKEAGNREMEYKNVIAFDIDNVVDGKHEELFDLMSELTGTAQHYCARVSSGYGCHYIIKLQYSITPEENALLFPLYKECCKQITERVQALGLAEKCDSQIWDKSRLLRLPGSINRKPEKGDDKECYLHPGMFEEQEFTLEGMLKSLGVDSPTMDRGLAKKEVPATPYVGPTYKPDPDLIFSCCGFLQKELATGGATSDEPTWRAALSIAAYCDESKNDGEWTLSHAVSKGHPEYTQEATLNKVYRVLEVPPRTCASIDSPECTNCPLVGKISSPWGIQPKYADYFFENLKKESLAKEVSFQQNLANLCKPLTEEVLATVANYAREFPGYKIEDMALAQPKVRSVIRSEPIMQNLKSSIKIGDYELDEAVYEEFSDSISNHFTKFHYDNKGNLKRVERRNADLLKFYKRIYHYRSLPEPTRIMIYTGKYYKESDEDTVRAFAQSWFGNFGEDIMNSDVTWNFYHAVKTSYRAYQGWDQASQGLVNFNNCILNIETMETFPHSPDYYFEYVLDYDYDPLAKCPVFEQMMGNIFYGYPDRAKVVLEFLGYSLSGAEYTINKGILLIGKGSNGKTTLYNAIQKIIGEENYSCVNYGKFEDHFSLIGLKGKLANFCEDEDSKAFRIEKGLKNLTGNTNIHACKKNKDFVKFKNYAKIWVTTNTMPELSDFSVGMQRRFLIVPCDVNLDKVPNSKIDNIDKKLKAERSGIFNLAIAAYKEMMKKNEFTYLPEGAQKLKDIIASNYSNFETWAYEVFEISDNENDKVFYKEIFTDYSEASGFELTKISFSKKMDKFCQDNGIPLPSQLRIGNQSSLGYKFLKFKKSALNS